MLHGTDVFISAEIKNNGVTIDYAYGCDNKKTDVTVDTNILYKKTHETYSVSTDIIGSTRWAFDSIGNVCASTEYDAWGNVTENSGLTVNASVPTVNITKSYTGHIYDEGTGFWNAGAREYDPFTKRFTSMDPENGNIYMPDTLHKYSYASNNPVMNVDLNGRFTTSTFEKAACSAVKAAIGGIYTFTKTTVNVWNDFNNLIDRIPAPVKAAVAIAGTGIAIASGVAPGAAVLTMAMAMGEGAAVNLAFYAVGSYVTGKQMTWKDAIKTAGKGALDGAFLNGIGQGIAGAGRILVNNKAGIKNFYVDETGSVKIDGVSGGKSSTPSYGAYSTKIDSKVTAVEKQELPSWLIDTYKDGQYRTVVTNEEITVYRAFGYNAEAGGAFATSNPSINRVQTKVDSAILLEWKNMLRYEAEIVIPKGTTLNIGRVGEQYTMSGARLSGGADQILLPQNWDLNWIKSIRNIKP